MKNTGKNIESHSLFNLVDLCCFEYFEQQWFFLVYLGASLVIWMGPGYLLLILSNLGYYEFRGRSYCVSHQGGGGSRPISDFF